MDQRKDITLHQRILNDIEGRIVSGEWPPGHRVPFEIELTKEYDCSRMTVNKALTQLAKAGLIERRKKSGSFVTQPQAQSAVLEIHDIEAEVKSLNLAYAFAITKRATRKAAADDIRRLELEPGSSVVEVVCIHQAGGRPFCLEERLISLVTVPEADSADFSVTPPGAWLLNQVPWSSAEHRIHAIAAGADQAASLDIPRNTACLVVERRTWSNIGPVTHVRFTYPGDKHALVARFTPAS
jgi:GntR family histidine utilization transcriptional repressor